MALAGCTGVFVGFESLENDNIVAAHKKSPRTEDYARRVEVLHRNGIQVNGSFVLGFDHDRADVFERTATWIEEQHWNVRPHFDAHPARRCLNRWSARAAVAQNWELFDTGHAKFQPSR
jgi:hypothetical protein